MKPTLQLVTLIEQSTGRAFSFLGFNVVVENPDDVVAVLVPNLDKPWVSQIAPDRLKLLEVVHDDEAGR